MAHDSSLLVRGQVCFVEASTLTTKPAARWSGEEGSLSDILLLSLTPYDWVKLALPLRLGLSIMNNMYSDFVGLYVLANIVQRQWYPRITPDIYSLLSS